MKIKNFKKIYNFLRPSLLFLALTFTFTLPFIASAAGKVSGLVYECIGANGYGDCTFADLVEATTLVVNQITIYAIAFSVIIIAWAGFKYMTSEGNPGKIKEATGMFTKVAIGYAFIICAWMLVNLIAKAFGVTAFAFTP